MSDTLNPTKVKALELAVQGGGDHDSVVKRAHAYHGFLNGAAPGSGGGGATAGATGKPNGAATAGATGKPNGAATATAGATTAKPAADKTTKPAADKTTKPTNKPAAAAAGTPTGQVVAPDTKAPGGTHNYGQMVAKLREVGQDADLGRDVALGILAKEGAAKSVRDVKAANYDKVVAACNAKLNGEGDAAGGPDEALGGDGEIDDPTATAPRDELGL